MVATNSTNPERGKRLKQLRKERPEISQKAAAAAAGVTPARVRAWENGEGMYSDNLEKIAAFYGVEVAWLDEGRGPKERVSRDLFEGLRQLEDEVREQGRAIAEIKNALAEDPRWDRVERHLNALSVSVRQGLIQAQDADEEGELPPPLPPIDLTPEEQEP